jgi:hypothetical protein
MLTGFTSRIRKARTFSIAESLPRSVAERYEPHERSRDSACGAVGNAVFNTGSRYLKRLGERPAQNEFENLFSVRDPGDRDVADRMIDWLIVYDASTEEFLTTLVGRLQDVLSRPE